MARTHPHRDRPTIEQLASLVAERPQAVRDTYLALHGLVLAEVPDIAYSVDEVDHGIGYGARQFGYNGWGMAAVSPHAQWVNLYLMQGARLPDPDGVLSGGAAMRHVKAASVAEVERLTPALRAVLAAAVRLHDDAGRGSSSLPRRG